MCQGDDADSQLLRGRVGRGLAGKPMSRAPLAFLQHSRRSACTTRWPSWPPRTRTPKDVLEARLGSPIRGTLRQLIGRPVHLAVYGDPSPDTGDAIIDQHEDW